ncbi:HIT family protein [Streptomyces griseoluteus]|uniref:HIT family protein n=1 Tax=Streptomyces griseoluteus TaxID=29306 RepID=UPI003817DEA0
MTEPEIISSPEPDCRFCDVRKDHELLGLALVRVLVPQRPHISPRDGGHLLVVPRRHVRDRSRLTPAEVLGLEYASLVAALGLTQTLGTEWFNYQENGNWSVENADAHMHLHVYGRARRAVTQPYGEALRFPTRSELPKWEPPKLSEHEVTALRQALERGCLNPDLTELRAAMNALAP